MAGLREISVDVVSRRGALALAGQVGALMALSACSIREEKSYKPVLYLYPEAITDVTVELSFDGRLTYTYPQPEQGADGSATWSVTAHPDGDLVDPAGRHYPSLFWEGNASKAFSQDEGFVVEAVGGFHFDLRLHAGGLLAGGHGKQAVGIDFGTGERGYCLHDFFLWCRWDFYMRRVRRETSNRCGGGRLIPI